MSQDPTSQSESSYEELSAYLDGELGPEAVRMVEARLARDPAYQAELQRLEHAWNLLDRLPRAAVGDDFTQSTLEMVAVAAVAEASQSQHDAPQRRTHWRLWGSLGLAALAVAGFFVGRWTGGDPNRRLLEDLPVLEHFDEFYQADDLAFLRMLAAEGLFADADFDPGDAMEFDLESRRERIMSMSVGEQQELLRRQERFDALPLEEQQRLRELETAIDADAGAERLHVVLTNYHDWLKTLSPTQRAELANMPTAERVRRVKRIQLDQRTLREQQHLAELPTRQDLRAINNWLEDVVWANREVLLERMAPQRRQNVSAMKPPQQRRALMTFALTPNLRSPGAMSLVRPADIQRLTQRLSEKPKAELQAAENLAAQRRIVNRWVGQSLQRPDVGPAARRLAPLAVDDVAQFIDKSLSREERDRLANLPEERMVQELQRLYAARFDPRGGDREPSIRADGPARPSPTPGRGRGRRGGAAKQQQPG